MSPSHPLQNQRGCSELFDDGHWSPDWPNGRRAEHEASALTDRNRKPLRFFLSADQVSDYTGAAAFLSSSPEADYLLADRGYDAYWLKYAIKNKGITP